MFLSYAFNVHSVPVYTNSNFGPALMNDEFDVTRITHHTYDQIASDYSSMINELVSDSWVGKFERGLLLFQNTEV